MEFATVALLILAALLVAVGIAGTVLPALPGSLLVLAGLVLAAWAEGFQYVGWTTIAVLAVLTALTYAADLATTALGAKRAGASGRAILGASLGVLAGLFFGLPGVILGPFVGAVIGEYTVRRQLGHAGRAGLGAWLGMVVGVAAKLALVVSMLGVFAFARIF